jgi:hypothetical protein
LINASSILSTEVLRMSASTSSCMSSKIGLQ